VFFEKTKPHTAISLVRHNLSWLSKFLINGTLSDLGSIIWATRATRDLPVDCF
jgi:hypothetical protein